MKKSKGPIRFEAIIPFAIVVVLIGIYFKLFFDSNLRLALQFVGYQVMGSEVNIASLNTSFLKGTIRIQGVEITDPDEPKYNMVQIGDIRFGVLWDALLRAKFVVNEMAVEQIEVATPRKKPGKVKPPEPKKPDQPGALDKLSGQATDAVKKKYEANVLGDIAAMASGTSGEEQLKNIEASLPSKARLQNFDKELKIKNQKWQERLNTLPKGSELQALADRLGKVKTKDFKNAQELLDAISQADAIIKEADAKFKSVQATASDLDAEIKQIDKEIKEIDAMVKKDIQDLQARFRIPKIDAKSLSMGIFRQYLNPYLDKVNRYKPMLEKYLPPKYSRIVTKKGAQPKEKDDEIQPHPRSKGVTYEFGKPNAYPLVWIKKISVSSKASPEGFSGDLSGQITDITSHQSMVNRPTLISLGGQFPNQGILQLASKISIFYAKEPSVVEYMLNIGSYPISGRSVVESSDVSIGFKNAKGSLSTKGKLLGLKDFSMSMHNEMSQISYDISAKDNMVKDIVSNAFADVPTVNLDASGKGELPDIDFNIESNLGFALQKAFEKQISKKIEEAKAKLNAAIDEAIGKEKARIEAEFNKMKSQVDGEIKKVSDQINNQKKQAENKVNQAKKDSEAQAEREKKKIENEAKKKIEDELKKRLGL